MDCLKQNEELRSMLDKLRSELGENTVLASDTTMQSFQQQAANSNSITVPEVVVSERESLKVFFFVETQPYFQVV
jgi:hypothetical protein